MQTHWLLRQYLFANSLHDKETSLLTGWMCWISGRYLEIFLFCFSKSLACAFKGICNCHLQGNNMRNPKYRAAVRSEVDCSNLLNYLFSLPVTPSWNPFGQPLGMYTWARPIQDLAIELPPRTQKVSVVTGPCPLSLPFIKAIELQIVPLRSVFRTIGRLREGAIR